MTMHMFILLLGFSSAYELLGLASLPVKLIDGQQLCLREREILFEKYELLLLSVSGMCMYMYYCAGLLVSNSGIYS
jgi:hypothetical protein